MNQAINVIFDFTPQLLAIQANLKPGITASLQVNGGKVYLSYSARVQVRGKRQSLGTFLTPEGAIEAIIHAKYGQSDVRRVEAAEINAKMQLMMNDAVAEMAKQVEQIAKPRESLTMEEIERLLAIRGLFYWNCTCEADVDVMDADDQMYTITKEQQSAYLRWKIKQLDAASE